MRPDRVLVVISLGLALAAAVLVTGPLDLGRNDFVYVFLPACFALIPLASDRLAALLVASGLMLMFVFLDILTIGVYYLPAAGAMSTAALLAAPPGIGRRRRDVDEVVARVRTWAESRPDVRAVALVGSWARETPRRDSDLDLVVLANAPAVYVEGDHWIADVAPGATPLETRHWGRVTERRLKTPTGLELDVGFATPDWPPIEDTRPLYDPDGLLTASPGASSTLSA